MSLFLDEEDAFYPQVEAIFKQIFARFDGDKDGFLNVSELLSFSKSSSKDSKSFSDEEIEEIFEYFDSRDRKLTLKGFLEMFQIQTLADEEETIKDLETLGFSKEIEGLRTCRLP
jgi:Ca2+-binding EF-hand superfamily protein